ncbi:lipoma-preferred partner homolog [Drosophila montana]|uniref:lipoma-preferred partner homolog n=1 Tax=Drosophila montana TaxID=40370 RepID=UPI00313EE4C2
MNSIEEQLKQLTILNRRCDDGHVRTGKVAALVDNLQQKAGSAQNATLSKSKTAPSIPPKPFKKTNEMPQVPLSKQVMDTREPLFSQPLLSLELSKAKGTEGGPNLLRRQQPPIYPGLSGDKPGNSQTTLDNPAVLEQQLEALAYHKQQMERKGLLGSQAQITEPIRSIPKLSSTSLSGRNFGSPVASIYSNLPTSRENPTHDSKAAFNHLSTQPENCQPKDSSILSIWTNSMLDKEPEEDLPPPPSPVSSSYSELRRASDVFSKAVNFQENPNNKAGPSVSRANYTNHYGSQNANLKGYQNKTCADYFGYGALSQSSSTYDSIYEPINPRPPSDISSRTNCNTYATYVNQSNTPISSGASNSILVASESNTHLYSNGEARGEHNPSNIGYCQRTENGENMKQYHLASIDTTSEVESYGRCFKCGERVLGESSGCTAMDQIYHISCFTCTECQINLQGKPFYALEGQPFCEHDYLQTLEKCSVCLKPILERILRATGKPYHPQCFTCVVCGNSLDAIPFTVDATNQNYCIADFHKKFAPRCCVCQEPIMPEAGQEETVRVVALDRSFHLECYKCEDCSLLLSSEADGRGCYPLDDHVLCKSCNARRVQVLTNRMTSEL